MGVEVRPAQAGFSLIEVLVAAVLFLLVVLGILPMFIQSTVNTTSGRDVSRVTNEGKSRLEEMLEFDLSHPDLQVTSGDVREVTQYWSIADETWKDAPAPSTDPAAFTRITRVRQFSLNDLDSDQLFDDPLTAGALDGSIHLKEVEVVVRTARDGGPLGPRRQVAMRVLTQ